MGWNSAYLPVRAIAAALVALAIGAALAVADPDLVDTQVTPVAKDTDKFSMVGGALFGKNGQLVANSVTPYTVDFFTLRFRNESEGYAGGWACKNDTAAFADLSKDDPAHCERLPVIWRYAKGTAEAEGNWSQVYKGEGHGYVGAIAYASPDGSDVLAVGGAGSYPRNELPPDDAADDLTKGAGRARVWRRAPAVYGDDDFHELDPSVLPKQPDETPMRGLTAIDCASVTSGPLAGQCFAGGLRQLWKWSDGEFVTGFGPDAGMREGITNVDRFRYRIRQISFVPKDPGGQNPDVVAMTAGCCGAGPTDSAGAVLSLDGARSVWDVEPLSYWRGFGVPNGVRTGGRSPVDSVPDSPRAFMLIPRSQTNDGPWASVVVSDGSPPASPDATDPVTAPASRILGGVPMSDDAVGATGNYDPSADLVDAATSPDLSSTWLLDGDGDFASPPAAPVSSSATGPGTLGSSTLQKALGELASTKAQRAPDQLMDWAVGQLRSTGQGIAYTTLTTGTAVADLVACPSDLRPDQVATVLPKCRVQPRQQDLASELADKRLFKLPTYSLNAFKYIPETGVAWAAGDDGALLRLGGDEPAKAGPKDPDPPPVGSPTPASLPPNGEYDAFRPLGTTVASIVPPLATRPEQALSEARLIGAGSPEIGGRAYVPIEGVAQIAMSRDGAEGWAVGPGYQPEGSGSSGKRGGVTLYHYDGSAWTRCDPDGVPHQLPPDRACAALAPLETFAVDGVLTPVSLGAIARVPLETDGDPSNDDDFEAIAFGDAYGGPPDAKALPVVLRLRGGVWSLDSAAMKELDPATTGQPAHYPREVVFTSPTEGWMTVDGYASSGTYVYRLHDGHWVSCEVSGNDCGGLRALAARQGVHTDHLAVAGSRVYLSTTRNSGGGGSPSTYPAIFRIDPNGDWSADYDPGCAVRQGSTCAPADSAPQAMTTGIVVTRADDGSLRGWATMDSPNSIIWKADETAARTISPGDTSLLRLSGPAGHEEWKPFPPGSEVDELLLPESIPEDPALLDLDLRGGPATLVAPGIKPRRASIDSSINRSKGSLAGFDGASGRWGVVPAPFALSRVNYPKGSHGAIRAMAPDNGGGFWAAVHNEDTSLTDGNQTTANGTYFYHYTDTVREPVFSEIAHPVRGAITAAAGGADGSFWVATDTSTLYRYDRLTGWGSVSVKGWDPGRLVTNPSPVYALAIGPDGNGLAVGRGGRIADLSPAHAVLDLAAGKRCGDPPCTTGQDLRSAALAPDGSALVGGQRRALVYRPADGGFRKIDPPPTALSATITGIAFPQPHRAWMTTNVGQVFSGDPATGTWVREALDDHGQDLSLDSSGIAQPLNAIAIRADGGGFAVGNRGVIAQRHADGTWRRLRSPVEADLTSVTIPADGRGPGAIVGGATGLVLTFADGGFQIARPPDYWDGLNFGAGDVAAARTVGVALIPGHQDGDAEAFAVTQSSVQGQEVRAASAILHYTSDPTDTRMTPDARVQPLPDSPPAVEAEVSFAAFGKSECHVTSQACAPHEGSNMTNDLLARRIADAIAAAGRRPGGPQFAVFTGDVNQAAGRNREALENSPLDVDRIHARWRQVVAQRIQESGLPLFGAVGTQDLSQMRHCSSGCVGTAMAGGAGTTEIWQRAMAGMSAPWGDGPAASHDGLEFRPVGASPSTDGKAQTHYAFDVSRDGRVLARMAVIDTSLRSMTAGAVNQNPLDDQLTWLDSVLANRPSDVPAILVSEDPTYSYGPGAITETQADATQLETILVRNRVSMVVSGRLGYNGLYWATAPGLHFPCAGAAYPDPTTEVPEPGSAPNCGGQQAGSADPAAATGMLAETLRGLGAPVAVPEQAGKLTGTAGATGLVPFVIAATAGGRFGPLGRDDGDADHGFWHGYTTIRLIPGKQPVIEQRPILDWIGVSGQSHVLRAGQRIKLTGYGREPVGLDDGVRYHVIDSPAITHRFDLVEADPAEPWLPKVEEGNGNPHGYVAVDPSVASIDSQSGRLTTGRGNHPRAYALAVLSVGDKAASWPIVFEPKRSYVRKVPKVITSPAVPSIRVLGFSAQSLEAPPGAPPPQAPPPVSSNLQVPTPPALPVFPTASAPPIAPPAPPAPPPPPASHKPVPLDLSVTPVGIAVPPPPGVTAQPTPPVQPAPPSGARREAKQRQAATAKSEEGGGEQAEAQKLGGDLAESPHSPGPAQMTMRARDPQPSAWVTGLEWGGGITLMAIALALGFTGLRPTPRRREEVRPAPNYLRIQR